MWLIDEQNALAMSYLPKNGTNSIRDVMPQQPPVSNAEALSVPVRIGWIRHPFERLLSAWSFFHACLESGMSIGDVRADTYEHFIDQVLAENNPHWQPQVDLLSHDGVFVPTACHRFENINHLWGRYRRGFIPHKNGCVHEPDSDYRRSDIQAMYSRDLILWNKLDARRWRYSA